MLLKKGIALVVICSIALVALAACGGASTTVDGKNAVHLGNAAFSPTSITIHRGESITLISDTFTPHFIANGSWEQESAKPGAEPGAPKVNNLQINGNSSQTIGPFNTAGTFKLYCTIHPAMNLTVVVV